MCPMRPWRQCERRPTQYAALFAGPQYRRATPLGRVGDGSPLVGIAIEP